MLITILIILLIINISINVYAYMIYQSYKINIQKQIRHSNQRERSNKTILQTQFQVIESLVNLLGMKDKYTAGHSKRVMKSATGFAKYMDYPKEKVNTLKYAAILHDIGKIGISEEILNKSETLTKEEISQIREHTTIGYGAIKEIDFLKDEVDIILHHHERVDGMGYPDGLLGSQISDLCKILTICDSFDAMTSNRIYRTKRSWEDAIDELQNNAGSQFDKEMVEKFIQYISTIDSSYREDKAI